MELTPILIRGKRNQKGVPNAGLLWRRLNSKRRQDRKATASRKKARNSTMVKPRASYLEKKLPLEILERIVWMSETVNLLRASPRIGRLLSGESTRRETLLHAFGPTWDMWFGFVLEDRQTNAVRVYGDLGEAGEVPAGFPGNPDFQSELLGYSWVDIDFILESYEIWTIRHDQARPFKRFKLWPDSSTNSADSRISNADHSENEATTTMPRSARQDFEEDYLAFVDDPSRKWSLALGRIQAVDHRSYPTAIDMHPEARIPDSLLTGPWDDGSQRKLFWLVRGGASLGPEQTWELTLEGFHAATDVAGSDGTGRGKRINMAIILLLFYMGSFSAWPDHLLQEESARFAGYRVKKGEKTSAEDLAVVRAILSTSRSRHRDPRRPPTREGVHFELTQADPFPHGITSS